MKQEKTTKKFAKQLKGSAEIWRSIPRNLKQQVSCLSLFTQKFDKKLSCKDFYQLDFDFVFFSSSERKRVKLLRRAENQLFTPFTCISVGRLGLWQINLGARVWASKGFTRVLKLIWMTLAKGKVWSHKNTNPFGAFEKYVKNCIELFCIKSHK